MIDEVLVSRRGHALVLTLNRPRAINALTIEMIRALDGALDEALDDRFIAQVVLTGAGERGLCAGGDIRAFHEAAMAGNDSPLQFMREEYELNYRISRMEKPVVSLMRGIVFGGGVGLAAHAAHRVVTESATVAMPEVLIGFVPDVGANLLFARAPGEIGTHMALSTARLDAADAIGAGFADYFVPEARLEAVVEALTRLPAEQVFAELETLQAPGGATLRARPWIDAAYSATEPEAILDALRGRREVEAHESAQRIASMSPTAVRTALRALRVARSFDSVADSLEMEYRIARTFYHEVPDFIEGIRAAVVDKDRQPHWRPGSLSEVDPGLVERCFVSSPEDLRLRRAP
jgi:enoyl-CoA hydratase